MQFHLTLCIIRELENQFRLSYCSLLLQSHRHEIHKSHNKAAAQWELREKALKRRFRNHAPLDPASVSIIREVCVMINFTLHIVFSWSALLFYLLNRHKSI